MEALFILFGELIMLPLMAVATILCEALAAAVACTATILESVFGITVCWGPEKVNPSSSPEILEAIRQKALRRLKFMKRLSWILGGVLGLLLTVALLGNFVFFEPAVRWGLARIEKRTGIKVLFQSATGNLFSGRLKLTDATVQRQESVVSNFDLRVEEIAIDMSMTEILASTARIESVVVSGLTGDFHRVATPDRVKIRRRYEVDHLRLEHVEIAIRDTTRQEETHFNLKVNELNSRPLRSQLAVFDVLFRSNASGEIGGQPFSIRTEKTEQGRETQWQVDALPVAFVARYLGGPFDWLSGGTVDVRVEDNWAIAESAEIKMRWSFVLKNQVVNSPDSTSVMGGMLGAAIGEYLRQNSERLDVSFSLTMNEDQFEGTASADAAGLGNAVRNGFVRKISELSGADPDHLNQGVQKGIDAFKSYLDKRRKKAP